MNTRWLIFLTTVFCSFMLGQSVAHINFFEFENKKTETYRVIGSSAPVTPGHVSVWSKTNSISDDGKSDDIELLGGNHAHVFSDWSVITAYKSPFKKDSYYACFYPDKNSNFGWCGYLDKESGS